MHFCTIFAGQACSSDHTSGLLSSVLDNISGCVANEGVGFAMRKTLPLINLDSCRCG